jgi:hypothetical protein
VLLTGAKQEYQLWNNCGPATLSTNLGLRLDRIAG